MASLGLSLLLALAGMTVVPWMLALMYGRAYAGAGTTLALGLATAVAHMGNAPAAARLTIVSLRSTAVINTIWAVFVAAAATLMLVRGGNAWQAMGVYFAGHVVSATLVLMVLSRKDNLPAGMIPLFALGMVAVSGRIGSGPAAQCCAFTERPGDNGHGRVFVWRRQACCGFWASGTIGCRRGLLSGACG